MGKYVRGNFLVLSLIMFLRCVILVADRSTIQPVLFNFGDSLSDTGGIEAGTGNVRPPPNGRLFFHHPVGRLCDGRLVIDFICESLNTTFLRPYLQSLGPGFFENGANFAVAAASTLPRLVFFNLDVQVLQFNQFQSRSLTLRAQGYEEYKGQESFEKALYIICIGGNDLMRNYDVMSYEEALDSVPLILEEIKFAVMNLSEQGARNFLIQNVQAIGCLPKSLAGKSFTGGELDLYGCLKPLNELATVFNNGLRVLCEDLRFELSSKNATVVYVDMFAIRYDIIANASSYGFKYTLTACCGYGGGPYNYNKDHFCGTLGSNVCANGTEYVIWDGKHYTEAANALTVTKLLSTQYSTPPVKLDFFLEDSPASQGISAAY